MKLELGVTRAEGRHFFLLLTQFAYCVLDLTAADRSPSLPRNVSAPQKALGHVSQLAQALPWKQHLLIPPPSSSPGRR